MKVTISLERAKQGGQMGCVEGCFVARVIQDGKYGRNLLASRQLSNSTSAKIVARDELRRRTNSDHEIEWIVED